MAGIVRFYNAFLAMLSIKGKVLGYTVTNKQVSSDASLSSSTFLTPNSQTFKSLLYARMNAWAWFLPLHCLCCPFQSHFYLLLHCIWISAIKDLQVTLMDMFSLSLSWLLSHIRHSAISHLQPSLPLLQPWKCPFPLDFFPLPIFF